MCIPTVDRPDLFREAVASIAAQTWQDFEIVVADNSGDPALQARIDGVLGEFPGLRFVVKRHPVRLDAIENFNSLIDEARSELWACLTDDDRFTPDFLARSVDALDRHPECAFTFADHWLMNEKGVIDEAASQTNSVQFGRTSLHDGVYEHDALFDIALKQSMCLQTALFRRPVIAGVRFVSGIMSGDFSMFLRLTAGPAPMSAYYIDARLFEYRIHGSQLSSTTKRATLLRAQIAALESAAPPPARHAAAFNRKRSRCYLALALLEAEDGHRRQARSHAATSLRLDPSVRTGLAALLVSAAPFAVRDIRRLRGLVGAIGSR